jgi:hypothetical protein
MAINSVQKTFGNNKSINYVGKDFDTLRQNLIEYAKTYYPDTYSDFNESSPGMIFIEMAAYVGDVLSYYQDAQLKESLLTHATERKNIMALAQSCGYKPRITTPAVATVTIYQLVPSVYNVQGHTGLNYEPDPTYYLKIKSGLQLTSKSNSSIVFRTVDIVDFSNATDRQIDVFQRETLTGSPELFLVSKTVTAISAKIIETSVTIPSTDTDYPTAIISDDNIIGIDSVFETSTNTKWYEVPYLAQESIFAEKANTSYNSEYSANSDTVPYMLEVKKVPNRFAIRITSDNSIELQFGNGNGSQSDELVLPNTKNVGMGLASSIQRLNQGIDPSNFLKTNTLGISPSGKTFTVRYLVGGGVESNINSNELTNINSIQFDEDLLSVADINLYNKIKQSVAVENLEPATGGRGPEATEEIRQNALATFGSQDRAVTRQDYIVRALNMPERYGSVAKVYVSADGEVDLNSPSSILATPKNLAEFVGIVDSLAGQPKSQIQASVLKFLQGKKSASSELNNPFAINMYVLGYDSNKKLTNLNQAIKQNLKTYLSEYRMLTDGINILNGFIINVGVEFEITVYSNYNKSEVLADCLTQLQTFFNIDNWTFNKPINISEIELILANVEGVLSVPSVNIVNLCGGNGNYSPNKYNITSAIKNKIVYPSLDPSIFEVRYPNKDIKGRAI